jgi:hypothetical protein
VTCGDAFEARSAVEGGFAGLFVDLFASSHLLPQLSEEETWANWLKALRPGGCVLPPSYPLIPPPTPSYPTSSVMNVDPMPTVKGERG